MATEQITAQRRRDKALQDMKACKDIIMHLSQFRLKVHTLELCDATDDAIAQTRAELPRLNKEFCEADRALRNAGTSGCGQ